MENLHSFRIRLHSNYSDSYLNVDEDLLHSLNIFNDKLDGVDGVCDST